VLQGEKLFLITSGNTVLDFDGSSDVLDRPLKRFAERTADLKWCEIFKREWDAGSD
jgi:hypothetical protein